jgi:CoA:oxalate CoA-transferase
LSRFQPASGASGYPRIGVESGHRRRELWTQCDGETRAGLRVAQQAQPAGHNGVTVSFRQKKPARPQDRLRYDRAVVFRSDAHDGDPNGPPTFVGIGIADVGSGVHTFAAIGYALFHRERTGIGQYIDIAMVDTLYHMHDFGLQSHSISGGEFVPTRMGHYHNQICPAGVYKGPQGWIFILVLDRQWSNMVKAMGRPELLDDSRFATNAERTKNADQLNAIVGQWMLSFPRDEAVIAVLEENRIACSLVQSVVDTMNHPHYQARNMVRTVSDPILDEVTIPGFPLKFSADPDLPEGIEAPLLGQHGEQVLREVLDYSESDLRKLWESGVLYSDNR